MGVDKKRAATRGRRRFVVARINTQATTVSGYATMRNCTATFWNRSVLFDKMLKEILLEIGVIKEITTT